jgi:hypothetical protein
MMERDPAGAAVKPGGAQQEVRFRVMGLHNIATRGIHDGKQPGDDERIASSLLPNDMNGDFCRFEGGEEAIGRCGGALECDDGKLDAG